MDSSMGTNAPFMALTFLSGMGMVSVTGLLTSLLGAVLVGIVGKLLDALLRLQIEKRTNRWRREAKKLAKEKRELEARLRETNDAAQL